MRRFAMALAVMLPALSSGCVSKLFYYPTDKLYQTPDMQGLTYEQVFFPSRDGTVLNGWFVHAATNPALGTILHFHGNAQNLSAHFSFVDWLPREGFNVFLFDYRGYGFSEGEPSRRGVYEDGLAAWNHLMTRTDIDTNRVVLLGQSLGGANAIALAGREDLPGLRAVVAESPFSSYRRITREKMGQMPIVALFSWPLSYLLLTDAYNPEDVADGISPVPLLLIHGTSDRVVPSWHSRRILERAKDPRILWTIDGGGHTEAFMKYGAIYRPMLVKFLEDVLADATDEAP